MTEAGVEGKNGWWMDGWIVALQRWIMVNEDSVFNQIVADGGIRLDWPVIKQ